MPSKNKLMIGSEGKPSNETISTSSLLGKILRKTSRSIFKEGDGIHGHHKTIIQQDIIRDQQLPQIGEVTTTIHGIKGKKIMQQPIHQGLRPKRIEFGWMDHHQWKEESRNIRKSYYLVSSHVKPLTTKL
jgi:hypothetical protein